MPAKQFIKIQGVRYRLSGIKKYKSGNDSNAKEKYYISILFSFTNEYAKVSHRFKKASERDAVLKQLDNLLDIE